jgi:hypothetical protein
MTDRGSKIAGACGLLFVALFAATAVLITAHQPSGDTVSNKEVISYFKDHKDALQAATFLMAIGGLCFLVFLGGVRERLHGERSVLTVASGVLMVGMLFALVAILGAIPAALDYQKPFTVDPGTGRLLLALSFYAVWYASIPAAVFVGSASAAAAKSGALPVWLTRAGYAVAVLSIVALVAFPVGPALGALWVIPVSVVMLRRAPARREAGRPTTAPAGA